MAADRSQMLTSSAYAALGGPTRCWRPGRPPVFAYIVAMLVVGLGVRCSDAPLPAPVPPLGGGMNVSASPGVPPVHR